AGASRRTSPCCRHHACVAPAARPPRMDRGRGIAAAENIADTQRPAREQTAPVRPPGNRMTPGAAEPGHRRRPGWFIPGSSQYSTVVTLTAGGLYCAASLPQRSQQRPADLTNTDTYCCRAGRRERIDAAPPPTVTPGFGGTLARIYVLSFLIWTPARHPAWVALPGWVPSHWAISRATPISRPWPASRCGSSRSARCS